VSARRRHPVSPARGHGITWVLIALAVAIGGGLAAVGGAVQDRTILDAVQRFMLTYAGVFALVGLTATVAAGLVACDRVIMSPAGRVVAQAVHRALSLVAVGLLVTHVLLEVLAHRSRPVDAVVPFVARGQTFYLGLGTLASDLLLLILATGIARPRFAARGATGWRVLHVTAYLAWPMAVVHGLLAGRHAKPYVDWSYGACLAAVMLALLIRLVATTRNRYEVAPQPVPGPGPLPAALYHPSTDLTGAVPPPRLPPPRLTRPPSSVPYPIGPASGARDVRRHDVRTRGICDDA
jgi:DMSO/TMAO reductase YedYZ heme-binding membrane subunit